ncbi:MAG: HIT family protein [Candidatus Cloacimonetes bacterium]|nr:HIT family protein [Candidatus Cloacimonadota bacterium]
MATIFSRIISGEIPSYRVAEDDRFYAFLDINPMQAGHTLVVPKQETDYLFDLDDALLADMMLFAKRVARAIEKAVECRRVGVMVIGLEVPHAHIHLIPIQEEGDMSLARKRVELTEEEFRQIALRIGSAFDA